MQAPSRIDHALPGQGSATSSDGGGQASSHESSDEPQLWRRWREHHDAPAREALLARHLIYAKTVAATYYGRRMHNEIEFDDYLQYARIGLLEAMDRYDPDQGAQFRTYAARRMHGAILDGIERLTEKQQQIGVRQRLRAERVQWAKREAARSGPPGETSGAQPKPDDLFRYLADVGIGIALCRLLEGTGMVDDGAGGDGRVAEPAYEPIEFAQLQRRTLEFVDRLPAQARTVVRYHYLQDHSFEQIAALMSVSRSRIAQIHRQALSLLRAQLAPRDHCDVAC